MYTLYVCEVKCIIVLFNFQKYNFPEQRFLRCTPLPELRQCRKANHIAVVPPAREPHAASHISNKRVQMPLRTMAIGRLMNLTTPAKLYNLLPHLRLTFG